MKHIIIILLLSFCIMGENYKCADDFQTWPETPEGRLVYAINV